MLVGAGRLVFVGLIVLALLGGSAAAQVGELDNGQRINSLHGRLGEVKVVRVYVPQGTTVLEARTWAGTGNGDLYVRRGQVAQPGRFDGQSAGPNNNESVRITNPRSGWWYVSVYGVSHFRNMKLQIDYRPVRERQDRDRGGRDRDERGRERNRRESRIRVEAPRRGERWHIGQQVEIRWEASRDVRHVRLQYSLDGGRTWRNTGLPGRVDARLGSYRFRVPLHVSYMTLDARVRVVDDGDTDVYDVSDRFAIREALRGRSDDDDRDELRGRHGRRRGRYVDRDDRRDHDGGWRRRNDRRERNYRRRGRDAYEDDNDDEDARLIRLGDSQARTLYPDEDTDWIVFAPQGRGLYDIVFSDVSTPIKGEIRYRRYGRDEKRDEKFEFSRDGGTITLRLPRDVEYIKIKVEPEDDDDTGRYTLTVDRADRVYRYDEGLRVPGRRNPYGRRYEYGGALPTGSTNPGALLELLRLLSD
jgi:hypothetical protein